ncbi:MAG TPA: helix-turn-helix domain-containing protein [Polyangiaceae bacterium]|jgi:hypothetical protein
MTERTALETLARGLRIALDGIEALLATPPPAEWVDQYGSPFGARRHCRLVREGKLRGMKFEGHVYVRRSDIDALLERHVVTRKPTEEESDAAAAAAALRAMRETVVPTRRKKA